MSSKNIEHASVTPEEAVSVIKKGDQLLKVGRTGKPYFRHFALSQEGTHLLWASQKKKKGEASVPLWTVSSILLGQKSNIFERNKVVGYENISFSLLYAVKNESRSLDIVCKDKHQYDVWLTGLRYLIQEAQKNDSKPSAPNTVVLQAPTASPVDQKESGGDLYIWGNGDKGMLGHGDESGCRLPKVVEALLGHDVVRVSCGGSHTAALTQSGRLFTWGAGRNGRLGHGHERDRHTPLLVKGCRDTQVLSVACGDYHTVAVAKGGQAYTFGKGTLGQLAVSLEKTAVPVPVVFDNSRADSPGRGPDAGETAEPPTLPADVIVESVCCGLDCTYFVTTEGAVYVSGTGEKGQLGLGPELTATVKPTLITALKGVRVTKVAAGSWHAVAVTQKGTLYTWGFGGEKSSYASGHVENVWEPKPLTGIQSVTDADCGDFHTVMLTAKGTIYTMGEGQQGQLGHGNTASLKTPTQLTNVLGGKKAVQVACGAAHTAALCANGAVYSWGCGAHGCLGHGNTDNVTSPTIIEALADKHVQYIDCGRTHMAVLVSHAWVPDAESTQCMSCRSTFTFTRRRHHCRNCGGLFCGACSNRRMPILAKGIREPVRVCEKCFAALGAQTV
eukprot:GCRY01002435.1.p1 GENE.GCRY01002435.1~~GCRY01002435.1.p1  ORF type:complete len:616 (+),score=164.16 GCRY01002435.1:108-1955(+)